MKIIEEVKNIKKTVRDYLLKYPVLRDDDKKLIAEIWWSQLIDKTITTKRFLELVGEGYLCNPESIRRCRQKIQQDYPTLRGKSWTTRQESAEEFKTEIKEV